MTNKFISLVDGNRSSIAPNLSTRLTRPDCVSFASRLRVLPILLLCLMLFIGVGQMWGADPDVTYFFNAQGYSNGQAVSSDDIDDYSSWSSTDGTNATAYYNTGYGLRVYNGGTFTISSSKTISSITLTFSGEGYTFSSSNTDNPQTVSPNASSYKWAVGRTCRLQKIEITYASNVSYDVHWKVNGQNIATVSTSGKPSVPAAAKSAAEAFDCEGKVFVGWSSASVTGSAPADLFTEQAGSAISGETTYNAVFATATPGAETSASSTLTVKTASGPESPYEATDGTTWTFNGLTFVNTNNAGVAASTNASIEMALPNTATCATSIVITATGSSWAGSAKTYFTLTGSGVDGSIGSLNKDALTYTFSAADKTANKDKAGTYTLTKGGANGAWIQSITINYKKQSVTYSNYATACCTELGQINGSVSWTNPKEAVVGWHKIANVDGNKWTVKYITNGGSWASATVALDEDAIGSQGSKISLTDCVGSAQGANDSCYTTISNLICGTNYDFAIIPTPASGYCAASDTIKNTTGGKFQLTTNDKAVGGWNTLTIKIDQNDVTEACNGSTILVAATADASHTGSATFVIKDKDGNDVTEAVSYSNGSFTMPAYNVQVCATFDAKECTKLSKPSVSVSGEDTYPYNVTFSWDAVSNADGYYFYLTEKVSGDDAGNTILTTEDEVDGGYSVTINGLEHLATYTYNVVATSNTPDDFCDSDDDAHDITIADYPTVTVTYSENGNTDNTATKKILTAFALPPTAAECSKTFVGWTTKEDFADGDQSLSSYYAKGANFTITENADITIYAVYADVVEASLTYDLVTSVAANDVVVFGINPAHTANPLKTAGALSSNILGTTSSTYNSDKSKITSLATGTQEFTIGGNSTDGWTVKVGDQYLAMMTDNKNKLQLQEAAYTWAISFDGNIAKILRTGHSYKDGNTTKTGDFTIQYNYNQGSDRFSGYASNMVGISLYKKNQVEASKTNYSLTCTGKVAKPTITGVASSTTYEEAKTVTITSATADATIKYTTDGSDPASSATTMASGSSFTLSTDGTYNIRAIAVKDDMTNSDEATAVSNVKIDIPYTTIASFITGAPATAKKLVFTAESNAVVLGKTNSNVYIQDGTGALLLYKSSHGKDWTSGKKVVGAITGTYTTYNDMPEMNVSDFGTTVATADGIMPDPVTITSPANADLCKLVKMEGVRFQSTGLTDAAVNITKGDDTYVVYNTFSVLNQTLPNSATDCDVIGVLNKKDNAYRISPISVDGISTNSASAILPTLTTTGSTDSENPTAVAIGKVITVTPAAGMTSTYKDGTAAVADLTSATNVTIDADKAIVVTANAYYYTENSATYYYHADESLTEYAISKASISNGSVTIKKGDDVVSSATPTSVITLTATANPNYHFGSWDVYKTGTDPHEAVSVDANNQFSMPAAAVTVNVNFVENNKYTIEFTANGATGDVPTVEAKHANTSFEVPGKGDLAKEGYKFAGWKVGNVVYHQGDNFTTPEEVPAEATTITFVAQWIEGVDFTWVAAEQGYSDKSTVTTATTNDDPISIVFAKADGTTAPTYYTNGTAVRVYGGENSGKGGTVTIATKSNTKLISSIEFTYEGSYKNLTTEIGSLNEDKTTWSGLAKEVVLTAEGGQARIKTITVTYITGTVTTLSIANVVMKKTDEPKDLEITCNIQNPTPEISYVIEEADQQYASIAAGKVTALKVTTSPITVTANIAQGSNYTAVSTTFTITVIDRVHPNLSFDEEGYEADLNTAFDAPTLNKPNDITEANISYSSSETSVADVDASTGAITINAEGETTITVEFTGDDKYDPQTVTYVLTVIDHTKDVLRASAINVTGSYTDWEDVTVTSGVKFAGNSTTGSGDNTGTIQLRAGDNSGIVTTSNIGYLKNLSATASSNTSGHYLEVYGKTTPYTSAADLYDNTKCGIKIGTIGQNGGNMVWETGKAYTDKYWYIGIKSKTGAAYYSDITFEWEPATLVTYNVTYSAGEGAEGETVELHNIPAGAYTLAAKPADFEKTDKIFAGWKANGEGEILAVGSNYTLSADVEFVAYWSDTYTITYSAGEGAEGEDVVITNKPEGPYTLADKPNDFDKFGFTFAGWKANGAGETLEAGDSYTVSDDVNFIAQWEPLPVWVTTYTSNLTVGAEEYTITIKGKNYEGQRYGTTSAVGVATIALRAGAERLHFHAAGWNDENVTIQATMNSGETDLGSFGTLVKEAGISGGGKTYTIATPNDEYYSIDLSAYTIEEGAEITFTATAGKRFVLFGVNQEGGNVPVLDHLEFTGEATKLNYEAGDVFDPAGLGVNAIYTIGEEEQDPVAVAAKQIEWSFDPAELTTETTSVEVTASHGGKSVSTTVENVVVVEPVPVITVSPASVNFGKVMQNSSVNARNITVTLKHIEAVTVTVNGSNVDAFDVQDNIASEGKISVAPTSTSTVGHFTATITVKDNDSETSKSISLTLDVEEADDVRGSWRRVTSTDDLEDGMKIVIAEFASTAKIQVMGRDKGNNRYAIESDLENGVLTPGEGASYYILKALDGGKYAIKTSGGKYLYAAGSNNNNYLKERDGLDENNNSAWAISFAEGAATIVAQGDKTNKLMRYNSDNSLFSCYLDNTKQSAIAIYAKNVKVSTSTNVSTLDDYADVVVTGKTTLTIDNSDKPLGNLTVTYETKIDNSANPLKTGALSIQSKYGYSGQIMDAENITSSAFYIDYNFYNPEVEPGEPEITTLSAEDAEYWYSICSPFAVNLNGGICQTDGTPMVFGQDFDLFVYDGSKRSETGVTGWKRAQGVMPVGVACLIGFNEGQPTTIRLKKDVEMTNVTSIALYGENNANPAANENWNGVGNPTLRHIDINQDVQVYDNNVHGYQAYSAASYSFVVNTPFFLQRYTSAEIAVSNASHSQFRAPIRMSERYEFCVRINKAGKEQFDNQMYVRASETANAEFEAGHDMITLNGTTSKNAAMIWTENYGGKRLAIEEAPLVDGNASYALGIFAPKNGEYRIEVASPQEDADLYLTYEGNIIWNLSMSAYPMELKKGNNEGYGLLLNAKAPMSPTDIDNIYDKASGVQKVVIDEKVFILRGGKMYDVTGKAVK